MSPSADARLLAKFQMGALASVAMDENANGCIEHRA